jgi:hypothetical protein
MARAATPGPSMRAMTVLAWPLGIALTSWHYMWRITPVHRSETAGSEDDLPAPLPAGVSRQGLQPARSGVGPLFHRRYTGRVHRPRMRAEELIAVVGRDPNRASPTEFARFWKVAGDDRELRQNDEFVVRMPGPWNGPVRVAAVGPRTFTLATLEGHLEAGQITFSAAEEDGGLRFSIESWARSGDRLSNLLYHHLRMAKEVQLHMWSSFLERVADLAGDGLDGGIEIVTRRLDDPAPAL